MPSSADYVSLATFTTLTPGDSYTALVSVKRASDAPTVQINASGTSSSTISSTTWTDVAITFVATGTDYIRLVPQTNASGRVSVDKLQVVLGTTAGAYFDGTISPAGDFSYAWSGTANASTSVQRGLQVTTSGDAGVAGGGVVQSAAQYRTGASSATVNAPKQASGAITSYITSLSASQPYTASAWVKGETGKTVYLKLEEFTSASSSVGSTNGTAVTMTGSWQRVSVTRTFGTTGVKAKISILNGSTSTQVFYYDNLMLENSPVVQDYFDGTDTSADADLAIVWTGTANASTSAYRGSTANTYSGTGGAVVASATTQKYAGTRSAKVYYTTNASARTNGLTFSKSLEASTIYTASAWVYTPAGAALPQFSIQGSGFTTVNGTAATSYNTWERISISFITDSAQSYDILLVNSAASAEDTYFYADNLLLEVSPTVRDYFDGSSTSAVSDIPIAWSGTANASTSVQTGSALTEYAPAGQGTYFAKTATSFYVGASSSYILAADIDHGMATSSFAAHTPEVSYTSSAWVKGESGKLLRISISEYDSSNALIGATNSANVTTTGSWQKISVTRTFSSTGVKSKTTIQNRTSGQHAFYADALMITDASYEGNYFDGNTSDTSGVLYGWTGSANASTSTLTTDNLIATNLVTNPSMESVTAGSTTLRTNLCTNPGMENSPWSAYDLDSNVGASTDSYLGTSSTQIAPISSGTKGATFSGISVSAGAPYTFSIWVKQTAGTSPVSAEILWYNGATLLSSSTSLGATLTVNTWTRIFITGTAPASATTATLNVLLNAAVASTDVLYADGALFEQTDQLRDFFDGATTDANGWDYGWSGTANASTSTAKAAALVTRTNLITNPTFEAGTTGWGFSGVGTGTQSSDYALSGTKSLKAVTTGAGYGPSFALTGVTSGATYYGSAWVYTTTGGTFRTQIASTLGTSVIVPANTWTRIGNSGVATSTDLGFYILQINAGGTFYVDNVLVEQSSTLGSYFDGSTGNSGDTMLTTWTGSANASTSTQSSVRVANVTSVNSSATQATSWASSGAKSLRVVPTTSSTASYAYVALSTVVGSTYTVAAKARLSAAQTGSLNTNARRISAWDASITNRLAQSSAAGNAAGATPLSTTFVATTSTTNILFYNGASAGNGDVWFDDFIVVDGAYVGPYFSGSTQPDADLSVAWTGTADSSTSTLSGLPVTDWLSTNGATVYRSSLQTHTNGYSAKVICDGSYNYQGIYMFNKPSVTPSNIYTASAWVLAEAGKSIRIGLQELTSAGAIVGTTYSSNIIATGSWQRFSVTRTFGSTGAKANVYISNVSSSSHIFYVDDVLIDASSSVRDYFDGSTGNAGDFAYNWTADANASTSIAYGVGVADVDAGSGRVAVQSTDWAGTGTKSVRVIATGTNAATDSEYGLIIASTGSASNSVVLDRSQTYTIYGTLRLSSAQTGTIDSARARRIWFSTDGGTTVASSTSASTNSAGTYDHSLVITTSATGDNIVSLGTGMEAGGGDIWWDKIMVVKGVYAGNYFDGSIPDTADITYVWNGDTDASTSSIEVNPISNWTGINGAIAYQDSSTKYAGNRSGLVTCNGVVGLQGVKLVSRATVAASTLYFASAWVKGVSGKTLRIELQEWTTSGTYIGSSMSPGTIANGQWQRISVSRTMSSTGTRADVVVTNVQASTHTFYVDSVLLEASSTLQDYFDGNYPAAGDFSYTWNGTPETSTSQYQAPSVNHVVSDSSLSVQSSEWKSNGSHSLRIMSTATSNDVSNTDLTAYVTSGLEPGKTYTVMAKVYRADVGTRAGSLSYQGYVGSTMTQNEQDSIPVAIGTYDLKITFTVANDIEAAYLRIFNNQQKGSGDIWVDDFIVIEGEYDGAYFDGDSDSTAGAFPILYQWNGTPHDSTSVRDVGGNIPAGGAAILAPYGTAERVNSTSALEITYRSGWLG